VEEIKEEYSLILSNNLAGHIAASAPKPEEKIIINISYQCTAPKCIKTVLIIYEFGNTLITDQESTIWKRLQEIELL
jgi:hypothetical protein